MSPQAHEILAQVLTLSPPAKAELADRILDIFAPPDRKAIGERRATTAENRIDPGDRRDVAAGSALDVSARIERNEA